MDKKLQDLTWSVLPKEFKEEVKKLYVEIEVELSKKKGATDKYTWQLRGMKSQLAYLFGAHNLTSDVEEEEMLTVSRKRVQNIYAQCEKIEMDDSPNLPAEAVDAASTKMALLTSLFGSKCLPDNDANEVNFASIEPKPAEPKFKVGDKVRIISSHGRPTLDKEAVDVIAHINTGNKEQMYYLENHYHCAYGFSESDLEPYTDPAEPTCTDTCTDDCPSQSRNLSQEIANCDKCNDIRLHIAAMAMQGILGNADRMKSYGQIAMSEPYEDLSAVVARNAVRYANALIAECSKDTTAG